MSISKTETVQPLCDTPSGGDNSGGGGSIGSSTFGQPPTQSNNNPNPPGTDTSSSSSNTGGDTGSSSSSNNGWYTGYSNEFGYGNPLSSYTGGYWNNGWQKDHPTWTVADWHHHHEMWVVSHHVMDQHHHGIWPTIASIDRSRLIDTREHGVVEYHHHTGDPATPFDLFGYK